MTLKEILEKLKNKFEKILKPNNKILPLSEKPNDNRQVLIPTYIKDLNIDTNLNDEELKRFEQYKKEIDLSNYNSILKYAEESFKIMNELRDSILEHIEESAKIKREISKYKDFKEIITEEFESVLREYEAYDLFDELKKIRRDTELRILAIQEKINEIEKSGKFKFWGARDRRTVQKSLIDVGDRLKINVFSGTLLANALNIELESNGFLRNSIENFIKENNNDEIKSIIEELLINYYIQNLHEYKAVSLLSKDADSKPTPKYSLDEFKKLELNKQLKVIVQDRKKLKEHISNHKDEFQPKLEEIKANIDKRYSEVLDDYRNLPLWSKSKMLIQIKLKETVETLLNYETLYQLFQENISEKDRENLCRTLFLALFNLNDGVTYNSNEYNVFLHKISYLDKKSYKICKKYFCKFIDEIMEKLVKTSNPNVVNYINKIIKNKSPESILNNPSSLSLISKLDRWGEYAYVHLNKDYSQFDDLVFSNYDDNADNLLELNLYKEIAKRINQKHINNEHITDNNFPSVIFLNPEKYFYESYDKIRLSDEIVRLTFYLKSSLYLKFDYKELIDKILSLDELSFYGIPDKEYDSSEKHKVMFELRDGKPHFKLKIGYRHTNILSRTTQNGFLEQFHNNLRLGLIDFLTYRYYSKEELQNLKDSGIIIEDKKYNLGIETDDGGLLCHGAGIYNKEQKELTQNFRKDLNNCIKYGTIGLSEIESINEIFPSVLFESLKLASMNLYFTDPLNFNRLFVKASEQTASYDINGNSRNQMDFFLNTYDNEELKPDARILIERACNLMDEYLEERENTEREEKE